MPPTLSCRSLRSLCFDSASLFATRCARSLNRSSRSGMATGLSREVKGFATYEAMRSLNDFIQMQQSVAPFGMQQTVAWHVYGLRSLTAHGPVQKHVHRNSHVSAAILSSFSKRANTMFLVHHQLYNPVDVIWDAEDWSDMNDDNSLNEPINHEAASQFVHLTLWPSD